MQTRINRCIAAALLVGGVASAATIAAPASAGEAPCEATASMTDVLLGQVPETTEGNPSFPDRRRARFKMRLSRPCATTVTVPYGPVSGTAEAGSDFEAASGSVTFAPGEVAKPFSVLVIDDAIDEENETFSVTIPSTELAIGDGTGHAMIVDDDTAGISITDVAAAEGRNGTTDFVFTVSMPSSENSVSVNVTTVDGTAFHPTDYVKPAEGVITFLPGQTTATFIIKVKGDQDVEPDETFVVNLSGATGGVVIADAQGVATIQNDDGAGRR